MKRLPIVIGLALAVSGCGTAGTTAGTPSAALPTAPPVTATPTVPPAPVLPPEPVPARDGRCPYLDTEFAAETNGQQVSKVKLSADQPPTCFFYRGDGSEQLRIQVLSGVDPAVAKAVVDGAAPIATSDPAKVDGGWEGGKQPTDAGAVFAVAKAGAAVVVTTNQQQTIKAARIAEEAITALGL